MQSPSCSAWEDDLTASPAFVLGRRTDILGWNPLAAALVTDFGDIPPKHRTYVRLLFTDPAMRRLYPDWENVARRAVAQLRTEAARTPGDPRMSTLVGERPRGMRTSERGGAPTPAAGWEPST
ncbi:hypothetical protein [Kribbella sp. NPDC006257]|uniref:MmyB family transcriptional regulator n=1 Tax=Kribbella sp. NPDC006257 TaxID=3156738 RepID=UPI0033B48DDD